MAPTLDRCGESRRLASLPDYLERLLAPAQAAYAQPGGVLGEARSYAQQLRTLQFCLDELVPLLRSSGRVSVHCGEGRLPLPAAAFRRLEGHALELLRHLGKPLPPLGTTAELAGLVGAPCVIVGPTVIPLSPDAVAHPQTRSVTVGGERYFLRSGEEHPFPQLLRDLRRKQERRAAQDLRNRPELIRMASKFLREVKSVLEKRCPRSCGSYQLFHSDADHQLQHSRGHWQLIRGPVASRTRAGEVFVGLHLVGCERREWLAVPPRPGAAPGDFWTPGGGPLRRSICIGEPRQYRPLFSRQLTDAEAVVDWLDAGVILVTGRSELHRRLRAGKETPTPSRPPAMFHRPGRPC